MAALSLPVHLHSLLRDLQLRHDSPQPTISTGLTHLDRITGGLPRGALTQIFGPPSAGCSTILCSLLAAAGALDEYCALVDTCDAFDPSSAAVAGVQLERLLWVRCGGRAEHAIKVTDLLIQGGGFGLVALDMIGVSAAMIRKFPLAWWYRFRRAVEGTPAAFVVLEREPYVKPCTSLAIEMTSAKVRWTGAHPDFRVLRGATLEARIRKPVGRDTAQVETRIPLAG